MNRNLSWIALGVALVVILCCCVSAVMGLGAAVWLRTTLAQVSPTTAEDVEDPTPIYEPVGVVPTAVEQETGQLVGNTPLPQRDLVDLARRLQGMDAGSAANSVDVPPAYELGDRETFWVHDVAAISFFTATASLEYATPHAYWWVEEGYEIPARDLERSAIKFENRTYPNNRHLFGSEWTPGIDGDPHVYIYLGNVPGVGGYFSSPDEYPTFLRPESNEHEMFYINLDNAMPGNDYFDGILAHEFQHMIHWAQDRNEDSWVNEGLSELAAHVNGYDVGGSDIAFSFQPDTQLNAWAELEESGPHYGASYLFMAYFLDRYGEEAVQQLVAEPANGIDGFNAVLARLPSTQDFHDLFADWVVANYLDEIRPTVSGSPFRYPNLQLEPMQHAAEHEAYPVHERASVHQYAADYIWLEGEGDLTVEFTGSLTVPLVGNRTRSGLYQWWSNRGDDGDATLTRAFDLTHLTSATLQAWMWYDLEEDWDYAYVAVSTDGGDTWDLLANEDTTTTNPSGNSYGPAFTGRSSAGGIDSSVRAERRNSSATYGGQMLDAEQQAEWSLQRFDLTPYVGGPVLIRFEVITDEVLSQPGLCLDDISIPELGYHDNVENGAAGWEAQGWLRVADRIPQQFVVQLVTLGDEPRVQRMVLDDAMRGQIPVHGLDRGAGQAVLIVSAMAPATTEKAVYSYQITQ